MAGRVSRIRTFGRLRILDENISAVTMRMNRSGGVTGGFRNGKSTPAARLSPTVMALNLDMPINAKNDRHVESARPGFSCWP